MNIPELLAPAGNIRNLHYALAYGADAVYAGIPRYSLRVRNNDFRDLENIAAGIRAARDCGRRFYLAANVLPHNAKVRTFIKDIAPVVAMGPDAFIMSDPGLLMLVRERWPELAVHLSVQANTMNSAAVRFWKTAGVRRIILSRELSLDEIAEIRQECPDIELEVFVHGALCIAYSGRCLLSGYFNHRDANQGACTNACRWQYDLHPGASDAAGDWVPAGGGAEGVHFLEERERPGELMAVEEDEHGTYIMNSRDLRAVQHVQRLVEIGVDSLKIEGRTKSHYYVARTVQVYRRALDDAVAGRAFDRDLLGELENLANRGYTGGFYDRHARADDHQNYAGADSDAARQQFVAEVTAYSPDSGMADVAVKNRFALGDRLVLITPAGNQPFVLDRLEDRSGNSLSEAPGGGWEVRMRVPHPCDRMGLIARVREPETVR